jgi:hypothetical protein
MLERRPSSPPKELDHDKVQCNLGFLEDEADDGFFGVDTRIKSKSDFIRRPSDIEPTTPIPEFGLLGRLAQLSEQKQKEGKP